VDANRIVPTLVAWGAVAVLTLSATAAERGPVALVGASYGKYEVRAIVKDALEAGEGRRYAHELLGEELPYVDLDRYALVIVAHSVANPLTAEGKEVARIRSYLEGGGHILLINNAPRTLAGELGLKNVDVFGMTHVIWYRNGIACKVLKPEHPFLKGVLGKTPEPKWLQASVVARVAPGEVDNIVGTDEGDCLIGYRAVGKGWLAYLGYEYFRLSKPNAPAHDDAPSWCEVVRNIIEAADPAVEAAAE